MGLIEYLCKERFSPCQAARNISSLEIGNNEKYREYRPRLAKPEGVYRLSIYLEMICS